MANDIGNITASLKLESAAFIREMTKAAQTTARSTSAMEKSMAGLSGTFAKVSKEARSFVAGFLTIAAVRQLAQLGSQAINTADEIAASARKIGVSAEELQRWNAAAQQADVDTNELETAFRTFQRNVATGKIAAEGRNMTEAFGNFVKSVAEAPTQIAKTEIAVKGAAKNAQVVLLLAASGAKVFNEELKNAFVVSERLVGVGDRLDDQWAKVMNALTAGFQTGFLEAFVTQLDVTQSELEQLNELAKDFGRFIGQSYRMAVDGARAVVGAVREINEAFKPLSDALNFLISGQTGAGLLGGKEDMQAALGMTGGKILAPPGEAPALGEHIDKKKQLAEANKQLAQSEALWQQALSQASSVIQATQTPLEQYADALREIATLQQQGAITAETAARAQGQAALGLASTYVDAAAQVTGTLASAFQDNKAFAIANAIVNVAQGITRALSLPFPLNWAQAAAVAVAGAAQIAAIRSARPGGGASSRGARSTGGGNGATVSQQQQNRQTNSLFIKIEGEGFLSRKQLENVMEQIVDAQRDGAQIVLAKT